MESILKRLTRSQSKLQDENRNISISILTSNNITNSKNKRSHVVSSTNEDTRNVAVKKKSKTVTIDATAAAAANDSSFTCSATHAIANETKDDQPLLIAPPMDAPMSVAIHAASFALERKATTMKASTMDRQRKLQNSTRPYSTPSHATPSTSTAHTTHTSHTNHTTHTTHSAHFPATKISSLWCVPIQIAPKEVLSQQTIKDIDHATRYIVYSI